jgi:signal transduction histidine kinase
LQAVNDARAGDARALSGHSVEMKRIGAGRLLRTPEGRHLAFECGLLVAALVAAAVSSSADQWRPASTLAALLLLSVAAEWLRLKTRTARISTGIIVLVVIMALLGPAPAAVAGALSMFIVGVWHRTPARLALSNVATLTALGVIGGLWLEQASGWVDPGSRPLAFAVIVGASLLPLTVLNFLMIAVPLRDPRRTAVRSAFVRDFLPFVPWSLTCGLIAGGAVYAYEEVGLIAVAFLVVVLAVTAPLLRSVVVALQRADSMSELRAVSDERAAQVARLASDRERLLREVLEVADLERRRLAETLHDGALQRLLALRQDLGERQDPAVDAVDAVLRDTRAVMAAFHPVTSIELGFEATVRAAAEPFAQGRVALEVEVASERSTDPLLCSVARELVTNAVKHARPRCVRVAVTDLEDAVSLQVVDDGRGIDSSQAAAAVQAGHVGLAVARRRVEDAGGTLELRTLDTGGTFVRATLPR